MILSFLLDHTILSCTVKMSPALAMVWHLSLPGHGLRTMPADSCGMVHHPGLWSIYAALWFLERLGLEVTRGAAFLCLRALELESPSQLRLEWIEMHVLRPFVTPAHHAKGCRTHRDMKAITEFPLYLIYSQPFTPLQLEKISLPR